MSERWFRERLHGGFEQGLRIDRLIHQGRTEFQSVMVIENEALGRVLILDGIVQTTEADEFVYHEMLAHVPLFAIEAPSEVLIIGGGDGGCLEEVLKHPIERATMIELDAGVVALAREHLSKICGGAFDDPRTELRFEDGARFVAETERRFDAIIIDSTDPQGPGEVLFSREFYADCRRRLTERGILVTQNGVPFFQAAEFAGSRASFQKLFRYPRFYFAAVPTYVGGVMAFGCASDGSDAAAVDPGALASRFKAAGFATRYYDPAVHLAAFAAPPYLDDMTPPTEV
ncbi:MAG: polyamine aminopropyltransferase [Alphaproteobacteria bacterium]|jgi:spermidine synthase|nr:polyamine aminopropyltransferase [Alphaproteobacteria bacterium]MDP6566056.1 polyamine aminopropyltransferase [Alphaproteobacteria bacterium]